MNRHITRFVIADIIAVLAFVMIGKYSHDTGLNISDIWLTAWPFLLGLFLCGWLLSGHRPDRSETVLTLVGITLAQWFVAVPFGLVLRELVYAKPILTSFTITTFIFGGLLLIGGRIIVFFIRQKGE